MNCESFYASVSWISEEDLSFISLLYWAGWTYNVSSSCFHPRSNIAVNIA